MSKTRKNRAVSMTLAAMATALTVGGSSADAANNGLSKAQVRTIVKKEVAKVPRIKGDRGPAGATGPAGPAGPPGATGPAGPAGAGGMPFLFAHVSADGTVDDLGGGITQANLDSIDIEPGEEEGITNEWEYCFTGLPPLSGGQVTIDGGKDAIAAITLETGNPDCSPLVQLGGQRIDNTDAQPGFHMLVY